MKPISNGSAESPDSLEQVGERDGGHSRHVGVIEVGDELGNHQEHEDQATERVERLGYGGDDIIGTLEGAGSETEGRTGNQEE